ncbi:MAG: enoyl-CoA hydratase/isomerase family protein, partial [Leucobacter sp.]
APDWSVRGVVLTGSGPKAFVAGADISVMRTQTPEQARSYTAEAQELTSWIETLAVPVVAAVNGFALGGGCEIAMACDYIFASENASFGQPEVALGLIPGFGGCVRLQQYVGIAAARELILTGRRIDAREAERLGLVLRVLPDTEALLEAAVESLRLASQQAPTAVAAAKSTVRAAQALPTDEGLAVERDAFVARFGTPDMVEGTTAFVEKRRPAFEGR